MVRLSSHNKVAELSGPGNAEGLDYDKVKIPNYDTLEVAFALIDVIFNVSKSISLRPTANPFWNNSVVDISARNFE